jgi:alanyl-tRNA synthetase
MTTTKLYLASDALTCTTTVTAVFDSDRGPVARFAATVCHPRGGGQMGCAATVNGISIIDVRHAEDGEVDHFLGASGLAIGEQVLIEVDPAIRAENARHHSAGHLIADAMAAVAPELTAVQGHHWPGEARVEFQAGTSLSEALTAKLQTRVDQMIESDIPFQIMGDPFQNRSLQIGNNPAVGCGGTHVKSSGALAGLVIRKAQFKKGVTRVSYGFA